MQYHIKCFCVLYFFFSYIALFCFSLSGCFGNMLFPPKMNYFCFCKWIFVFKYVNIWSSILVSYLLIVCLSNSWFQLRQLDLDSLFCCIVWRRDVLPLNSSGLLLGEVPSPHRIYMHACYVWGFTANRAKTSGSSELPSKGGVWSFQWTL